MRIVVILFFFIPAGLLAQNKSLEYFAKVPTRFEKPGLSPMQSIRLGYIRMPGNTWTPNVGEIKFDLFRFKFSPRASAIISTAAWGSFRREKRDLYEVNGEKAIERVNYYLIAPAASAGISYGFFYPYYVNARVGFFNPWRAAYYKSVLPIQHSESDGIETLKTGIIKSEKGFQGVNSFVAFEVYRPFHSRAHGAHPMGWSLSYLFFPGEESGAKGTWGAAVYWHIRTK